MAIHLVLLTAIFVIGVVKFAQQLYKRFQLVSIIDKIPGPKAHPIVGNAIAVLRVSRGDRSTWYRNLCGQYKEGIFRTWMGTQPYIHLTSADTVGIILTSKTLLTKSSIYDFIRPWLGTGLVTSTDDKWQRHRKLINPTFHINILEEYAVVMSEKAEILKQCIASKLESSPKAPIDMFELLPKCALDIICESAMGINIHAQRAEDTEYSAALHSLTNFAVERLLRPWLHADWIYYRTSRGKEFKRTVEIAHGFTNQVISERIMARKNQKQNPKDDIATERPKRLAFLDHLLDACDRDNVSLTEEELREEVDTFMFAGHDTTSMAMSWALFCIGNHPEVGEKIHQEQLEVFGNSTKPATLNQISELKYLERVMKETLRLFPSAPEIGRRLTEDVEIAGYKIPKNTGVGLQIDQVHRDPKYWPGPEKFDPDRFLPENSDGRHPHAYIAFSAGPRNCIGQKFSYLEQKVVLTAVLRTWRVRSLLKFDEAKCYRDFVLRPQDGIDIYFTPK